MSDKPSECKFCGCREIKFDNQVTYGQQMVFKCNTVCLVEPDRNYWSQDAAQCGGIVGILFRRIRRVINILEDVEQMEVSYSEESDTGLVIEGQIADAIIEILMGKQEELL